MCGRPTQEGVYPLLPLRSEADAGFLLSADHSGARDSKIINAEVSTNDDAFNDGCSIAAANDDFNVVSRGISSDLQIFFSDRRSPGPI